VLEQCVAKASIRLVGTQVQLECCTITLLNLLLNAAHLLIQRCGFAIARLTKQDEAGEHDNALQWDDRSRRAL
jgi:hypothetical protein